MRKTIAQFTRAELEYDIKAVDRLLDASFVYVGNDGSLTGRSDFLRLTDKVQNPLNELEITEVQVAISGETAIATGEVHEKGLMNGRPYEFRGRTLNVLVRRHGHWLFLAIHD